MSNNDSQLIYPFNTADRIISIDVLRGIAVLGILIMNIQNFSMPNAAYINPQAYGDLTGINKWVWILSYLFASEKFMSIFSLLFGAGVLLFTDKAIAKGRRGGQLHYRRMMWLLIFGMIHAYLIWSGDILVAYSLCGMLAFVFRKKTPGKLIGIGIVFFVIPVLFFSSSYFSIPYWTEEAYNNTMRSWKPDIETIFKEVTAMQGTWFQQMESRVPQTVFMQTWYFLMGTFWRVMSMMLMGMALYKWRILNAEKSYGFYIKMAIIGLLSGYVLAGVGVYMHFRNEWAMEYSMFLGKHFNYFGSVGVALGYTAIVMLICKSIRMIRFKRIFAAVGRMAFTNYILQSIICVLIFYGHGLGLYGRMERKYQIVTVFAVWIVVLIISPIWLKYFRFGPLEWLWRCLTYWRWQPFRKKSLN